MWVEWSGEVFQDFRYKTYSLHLTSYVCDPTNTETESREKPKLKFRLKTMLKDAIVSLVAVMVANWHGKSSLTVSLNLWGWKSISHTTDMTQTSYIQRPMYMTPLILKLKLREKSHFRL